MNPFTMALLGGAGSAIGGLFSAGASRAAGQAQSQASMMSALLQAQQAEAARAQQERMYQEGVKRYQEGVERMEPFRQGGVAATNRMLELYGIGGQPTAQGYGSYAQPFGMADYQADPGYAFRVQEGQKAIDRSAAAQAGLQSGSALRAAARYGQEMGSQEYGNAYNRFLQQRELQLRALQGLAAPGSSMAAQAGQLGAQTSQLGVESGRNIANTMIGASQAMGQGLEQAGQARASSYMGGASALGQALNAVPQNYMMYSMMDRFAPGGGQRATLGDYFTTGPFPSSYRG